MTRYPAKISHVFTATALVLLLPACGGGRDAEPPGAQPDATGAPGDAPPSLATSGRGPDPAQAQERLLANANMITPDAARLVSYNETGVRYDGPPEMLTAIVNYEAELEFTADTYFVADHKAGDRAKVYGEAEYLKEGGNWRLVTMGIYPR
jgi:hypothetical protein